MNAVAAPLEPDLSEPLSFVDDYVRQRTPDGCPQSTSDPHTHCVGAAGVLRYNRESENLRINLPDIPPAPRLLSEHWVQCEFCGKAAKPSLDLRLQHSEAALLSCCAQRRQLREALEEHKRDRKPPPSTSLGDRPDTESEELLFRGREVDDPNKFILDLQSGLGEQPELLVYEDSSSQPMPAAETSAPTLKVLSFRLSRAPEGGCWAVCPDGAAEERPEVKEEEEQLLIPSCDHKPLKFGLCHRQDGSDVLQRNYPSGEKFLIMFPDGSAQVFYPSGLLALIVVVTEESGRVCIVYDDRGFPHQPVRALFQSDGRATCYHSNGNIWLSLNRSGGQSLDEEGTKVRQWNWSGRSQTPPPLHPIFMSLNKTVGVRVLGREQVVVSFLARGRQARFSVGSCCAQDECQTASRPPALKEEPLVLAARMRIVLAIQHLHQHLKTPSHQRPRKILTSVPLPESSWQPVLI